MFVSPYIYIGCSVFPFMLSISLLSLVFSTITYLMHFSHVSLTLFNLLNCLLIASFWSRLLLQESVLGYHSFKLDYLFRVGILLFILSEIFLFVSFFWAFFDASLVPVVELGIAWPPVGLSSPSPFSLPLLNTILLITRGIRLTWSHHQLLNNKWSSQVVSLLLTVLLGFLFLFCQAFEYFQLPFSMSDSIFGSIFYLATGFHGFHVFAGLTFLTVSFFYSLNFLFLKHHHLFIEFSCWYWHFVDVVWLFLFIFIYWWGA
jgi:cytochrome c oxidase subunit 3